MTVGLVLALPLLSLAVRRRRALSVMTRLVVALTALGFVLQLAPG